MPVLGVGGVFFRSESPEATAAWYVEHLGVGAGLAAEGTEPYDEWSWTTHGGPLVFAPFASTTDYWEPAASFMLNLRVSDLDGLLAQLEASGIAVALDPAWDSPEAGRFARIHDPDGRPVELWEPPTRDEP